MYIDMKSIFYYKCALVLVKIQFYFMSVFRKKIKDNQKLGLIHLGLLVRKKYLLELIYLSEEIKEDKLNKYLHNK